MVSVLRARLHTALGRFVVVAAHEPLGRNPRALTFSDEADAQRFLDDVAFTGSGSRALGEFHYQLTGCAILEFNEREAIYTIASQLAAGTLKVVPLDAIEPDPNQVTSVGMNPRHAERLREFCRERRTLLVIRDMNVESLKFHEREGYASKGKDVKLKTAKPGQPHAGQVVKPSGPEGSWQPHERENWQKLNEKGYRFDNDGLLRDPDGNAIHGDYDIQGAYRVNDDGYYDQIVVAGKFLDQLNQDVCPERAMFRHGANDEGTGFKTDGQGRPIATDPGEGNVMDYMTMPDGTMQPIMWRKTSDDERFLVFHPTGATSVLESAAELKQLYEARGLSWLYSF
jgi:hypothetical protein